MNEPKNFQLQGERGPPRACQGSAYRRGRYAPRRMRTSVKRNVKRNACQARNSRNIRKKLGSKQGAIPMGSMGLVYLPTFTTCFFRQMYAYINHTTSSYGIGLLMENLELFPL